MGELVSHVKSIHLGAVPDEPYSCSYVLRMVLSKNWQKYHQFGKN